MKIGFFALVVVLLASRAYSQENNAPANPTIQTYQNSEGVLDNIQGENHNLWIISFYQRDDNHDEVKSQILAKMQSDLPDETYNYGEVPLGDEHNYRRLYETLDLTGEPKRGHTTPQVLVMKDGEGYVVHGPKIAEGIVKRYKDVRDKKIFKKK